MNKEIVIREKNINFSVNPFLECLGVAFILAEFNLNKPRTNKKYIQFIKNSFSTYKSHRFVEKIKTLLEKPSFKYDAPVEMALNMWRNKEPSKQLLERAGLTKKDYKILFIDMINFIETSNFYKFFIENQSYYAKNLCQYIIDINQYSPQTYLFNFLGLHSNNLNIVLMFGISTANYGIKINKNLYCCIRPYKESRFGNGIDFCYDLPYMTTLILHEFAHSFINPITENYREEIENIDKKHFELALQNNPYGEHAETVVNETIIRAIECLYVKEHFIESYQEIKQDYINDGFIYIPQLEIAFDYYLSTRNCFKTIKEFYPELIKIFNE